MVNMDYADSWWLTMSIAARNSGVGTACRKTAGKVIGLKQQPTVYHCTVISMTRKNVLYNILIPGGMVVDRYGRHRQLIRNWGLSISEPVIPVRTWRIPQGRVIICIPPALWHWISIPANLPGTTSKYPMTGGVMMSPVHPYYLISARTVKLSRPLARQASSAGFLSTTGVVVNFCYVQNLS